MVEDSHPFPVYLPPLDIRRLYDAFDTPVTDVDCGQMCAPHNPAGVPFCCDICHAVPPAYRQEWDYVSTVTDLWHEWRGDECAAEPVDPASLREQTPAHMRLLACLGAPRCRRAFRLLSCRQFPFFPYITADDRFIGLAYFWDFSAQCWVIHNLERVTDDFRRAFVATYDYIFSIWQEEYEAYADTSEEMRRYFAARRRRIPILHRNGRNYLLSPASERLRRIDRFTTAPVG
ncbi:MAG: hypothetical protein HPY76_12665 [Anaerolineae bacterium]|nr:hypothetical protein [Anaerolineae bacterium]